MKWIWIIIVIVLAGIGIYYVTRPSYQVGNSSSSTNTSSSPAATNAISISNFTFEPSSIIVSVGSAVTITNNDSTTHRPISDSSTFDFGQIAPGQSSSHTFNTAGTFPYHCSIHPEMTGTIIVQ